MTTYTPTLPDVDAGAACAFCGKYDKVKNMYIATLDINGDRVFPIDPSNYVLLCWWDAHFDSKADRDLYTYWLLDQKIYDSLTGEGQISDYNGIV